MSRLPTVGGDTDTWGTVLNDYLTETAGVATLTSSPAAGATQFDLAVVPPGLSLASFMVIDAFTTEAELRKVSGIAGNTITVQETKYAHAAGDTVLVLQDWEVTPAMFGMTDRDADNWSSFQRMALEAAGNGLRVVGQLGLAYVWRVSQPVCVLSNSSWQDIGLKTHGTYAPLDANGALCMVANRTWHVTATASDNVFTVAAGHGMSSYSETNHTKVAFNAPYGESLPGGITAGKVYFIDTVPNGTTFTISATSGGAILDVTSDGDAQGWESIQELSRVFWDNIRFDLTVSDVNGVMASLQQPAFVRNLRVEMDADASTRAYGAVIGGQIAYIDNVMINPAANCTCMLITGTGITIRGFNANGISSGDIGIEFSAYQATVHNPWTEGVGTAGIKISGGRAISVVGAWMHSGGPALLHDPGDSVAVPYEVGPIYLLSGSNVMVLNDVLRGIELWSAAATDPREVATDNSFVFPGWTSPGSTYGPTMQKPMFRARFRQDMSFTVLGPTYKVRHIDELVNANSTGGSVTLSLPAAFPWGGHQIVLRHATGGNTCTVDTVGTELIDGAGSITIPVGNSIVVMSDGTDWRTING